MGLERILPSLGIWGPVRAQDPGRLHKAGAVGPGLLQG